MKPSAALEANREAVRAAVSRRKAANPRVFGSVLRGEDEDGGDIDILVDAYPARPCWIWAGSMRSWKKFWA